MRRGAAAAAIIAGGAAVVAASRPLRAELADGALPGRAGSWVNSYLGGPTYRLLAQSLELSAEDELLDVACGWGAFLVVHAAQARRVAGIDHSPAKVDLARQRLADRIAAGTAEVCQGDAARLPWPDATFTAVTCMDAFPLFTDPAQVLAEMLRVLRPGGRVVMQIGARWPDGPPKHSAHPRSPVVDVSDEQSVRRLFEDVGFEQVTMSYGPGSSNRLGHLANLKLVGSDEPRVIRAVKPDRDRDR